MPQKSSMKSSLTLGALKTEWDPDLKEGWHLEFEKQPVNDNKWSCIVTAAVPSEAQNQEFIQLYNQCVSQGLRKAIKTITMDDVIKLLKLSNSESKHNRKESTTKNGKNKKDKKRPSEQDTMQGSDSLLKSPGPPFSQIIDLAAKHAVVIDNECKLPPDLMAGVLKYLILNMKEESCLQKKINIVKEKKMRLRNLKAKFIRNLSPYVPREKEAAEDRKFSNNCLHLDEPINDEPVDGPDLYILLIDFYDLSLFPELRRINVMFLAILEISVARQTKLMKDSSMLHQKSESVGQKKSFIASFWEKHNLECNDLEKVYSYKDIATVNYKVKLKSNETSLKLLRNFFNELSWTQYSVYVIYRQHQKYLQELYVQRMIVSSEPLNLSKCVLYNKLCDKLITGGNITSLLVLYAIIEQVVAGVPETNSVASEYQTQSTDFFFDRSEENLESSKKKKKSLTLVTPCLQCKNKEVDYVCEKPKENTVSKSESLEQGTWSPYSGEYYETSLSPNLTAEEEIIFSSEHVIPESYLDQTISEKQAEKDFRNKKKWEAPSLCFFGDSIFHETSHCRFQLFNAENLVERFLKNCDLIRIWDTYPQLTPEKRAFYNFHFYFLKTISEKTDEVLKLYIYFSMLMKLVGIANSFTFRGDEDNFSASALLTVQFEENTYDLDTSGFCSYFLRTFIRRIVSSRKKENEESKKRIKWKFLPLEIHHKLLKKEPTRIHDTLHKSMSQTSYFSSNLSETEVSNSSSSTSLDGDNTELFALFALLDCFEISSLIQSQLLNKEEYKDLIGNFKFYEKLEPYIMIQRLLEAQNDFNTTQSSYFPLTDTIFIIMYDEHDHRGISSMKTNQILPTPVHFRDFHSCFYPVIADWLIEEVEEHEKFVKEFQDKAKAEAEEFDLEYLNTLKEHYCLMNKERKKAFLETDLENEEIEVTEEELEDLPVKLKPFRPDKVSFIATNYMDFWVEFTRKTNEFKFLDGTEVNVKLENWLYSHKNLLRVQIKLLNFDLYYNQWLEEEKIDTSFTFKTKSGIIFSFYKNEQEEKEEEEEEERELNGEEEEKEKRFNYHLTISWPTGLIIQPVTLDSTTYIRQSYIKTYRKNWDVKEEASRGFVKNGQVVIFNENGGYEVLCPSGTKFSFLNTATTQKYEITSTTGEVWEVHTKERCKNKKYLLATMKVLIGVDKKAEEIFYKREDGVNCLLWSSGKLVTTYPDGTKITSTPDFDENEVSVEWTEEEKLWLKDHQWKKYSELSVDRSINRLNVKNKISFSDKKIFEKEIDDNFVSVSCSYLVEHPKYSTVYISSEEDNIRLTMPEEISLYVYPGGNYVLKRKNTFLKVCDTIIETCKECPECKINTTVNLFLYDNEILCKCVDVLNNVLLLYRNGKTMYEENNRKSEDTEKPSTARYCVTNHNRSGLLKQRCFSFERDLSGMEFLHEDSIAMYANNLSENTYYDMNTEDPSNFCHTFTCPYYKTGSENWEMNYENEADSLPTNLKKKHLKEIGAKEVTKNLFKYPFPRKKACGDRQQTVKPKENVEMPKLIVARTIWGWPENPYSVIENLKKNILIYQDKARSICSSYKNGKVKDQQSFDSRYVKMRLRKIALTLNQSLQMYPHLCTQFPSTEKEIHYFGHFINTMEDMKSHFEEFDEIPDCKQIPIPLPRSSDFPSIYEENESLKST